MKIGRVRFSKHTERSYTRYKMFINWPFLGPLEPRVFFWIGRCRIDVKYSGFSLEVHSKQWIEKYGPWSPDRIKGVKYVPGKYGKKTRHFFRPKLKQEEIKANPQSK